MLHPALLSLIIPYGFTSIASWAAAARVPVASIYQARHGRPLPEKHLVRLAEVIDATPATVRSVLCDDARSMRVVDSRVGIVTKANP